ncbi:MAG: hypothetical protein M1465_01360 [Candidatus Marsarchaeota archaeon]|jgi:hypothetical protein|nr:hypothetical protein [Candidatus Marsarchaeota archaeon]
MFKKLSEYEIDSKSRLVKQLPLEFIISDSEAAAVRNAIRHAAEAALGRMPFVSMSLSNDKSDPRSMVRIDKYEFIINSLDNGKKSLMIRSRSVDAYDKEEINEFLSVTRAAESSIKQMFYQRL